MKNTRPNTPPPTVHELDAEDLTGAQRRRIALLDQPRVVRRSHRTGDATVYVYHQTAVFRYLVAPNGTVIDTNHFHAGSQDRAVRQQLLAALFRQQVDGGKNAND